ncbi:MAG TPA: flavin reductase family protein [Burkholderiaceae bacterium]|jgi:flavin reductase (DIM6/NTAB) family NADH-FMN oxidoreductase RutF|nr:flavin reductase family protein [Burkholderiaceae bacterium]
MTRGPFEGGADSAPLRSALGRFATGVTVATCTDANGAPVGLTVNSFGALSLEPPLVQWSLRCESPSLPAFQHAEHFAINVLTEQQVELSRRFASASVGAKRFEIGRWSLGTHGAPVLAGALAVFECRRTRSERHGDHVLVIGEVLHHSAHSGAPLLFHASRYRSLGDPI